MKRLVYALLGVAVLTLAGFMIYRALDTSLVYFLLPSEYAQNPGEFRDRRLRLGGVVEAGSVAFDEQELQLSFQVTDSLASYPVRHRGAPPELFQENTGVVVEGGFQDGVFVADNVLIKHSEVYEPPADGAAIDIDVLKDTLQ